MESGLVPPAVDGAGDDGSGDEGADAELDIVALMSDSGDEAES